MIDKANRVACQLKGSLLLVLVEYMVYAIFVMEDLDVWIWIYFVITQSFMILSVRLSIYLC
jgi:hypothetical protein